MEKYENYPCWIVTASSFFQATTYLIGSFLMYKVNIAFLALYVLLIAFLEFRVLTMSCVNCYYYGKLCAFGRGKSSSLLFKKGTKRFGSREITWKDVAPDFLVSLVPIAAGAYLLVQRFDWLTLAMIVVLFALMTAGNAFVRGSLACAHCKQSSDCPAAKLFGKKK